MIRNTIFYLIRPFIPRRIQLCLRRYIAKRLRRQIGSIWPIDLRSAQHAKNWPGWPDNKQFAFVLTHDVDTTRGLSRCLRVAELDKNMGFKSSFNFVPESRYTLPPKFINELRNQGFGIGVHGLRHDGKLFSSYNYFVKCAARINDYLKKWNTSGFSSPSMHHNLAWMHHLDIEYATSTFDTDPFEPQPDSVQTIFPFVVHDADSKHSYVELPYTLPQDFTLFIILGETTIDIWKHKLDWLADNRGMALVNAHPDYMWFNNGEQRNFEDYPVALYREFLSYISSAYSGRYWSALPQEVASYVKKINGKK